MFKGIQKFSLIDFPGTIATTLFTGGCNFRCPWCHNLGLVNRNELNVIPDLTEDEIKKHLVKRKGKVRGICISGGEPTLWGQKLAGFMNWGKENGFLIKLDTNGYAPNVLQDYIRQNLIDFIAMDIKNVFNKYCQTAGMESLDITVLEKSIGLIKNSGIRHQFRTTLVPGLVIKKEMIEFSKELGEDITYQEYRKDKLNFYAANIDSNPAMI